MAKINMMNAVPNSIVERPLISVILPAYNAEKTITKALTSILRQSYQNLEILIYDDASSDTTKLIIQSIILNEPRAKLFGDIKNMGVGYARNYLLQKTKGDYFAFLDSDDEWGKMKIEQQIKFMMHNDLEICSSYYSIVDEEGKVVGLRTPPTRITYRKMHLANWLPMSMTIVKASLNGSKNMPLLKRRQDYAYWLNIFKHNKNIRCRTLTENLGSYTRRQHSLSSSKRKNLKYNFEVFHCFMGYNKATATFFVLLNILTRITRA